MDTSEQYIKMCDCLEIQGIWRPRCGDYIIKPMPDGRVVIITTGNTEMDNRPSDYPFVYAVFPESYGENREYVKVEGVIWLPRQGQLQEMVVDARAIFDNYGYGNNEYNEYMELKVTDYWDMFISMEQLWLAFVMKEKYSKVWNGTEWTSD